MGSVRLEFDSWLCHSLVLGHQGCLVSPHCISISDRGGSNPCGSVVLRVDNKVAAHNTIFMLFAFGGMAQIPGERPAPEGGGEVGYRSPLHGSGKEI